MQVLTQVLQLLQNFPLEPCEGTLKRLIAWARRAHASAKKKSTAELVVEKETPHTQQTNALSVKQVEYDQILAKAQVVAEEMNTIRESVLVMEGELQTLRTELLQSPGLCSRDLKMCVCLWEHQTSLRILQRLLVLSRTWVFIELRTATRKCEQVLPRTRMSIHGLWHLKRPVVGDVHQGSKRNG